MNYYSASLSGGKFHGSIFILIFGLPTPASLFENYIDTASASHYVLPLDIEKRTLAAYFKCMEGLHYLHSVTFDAMTMAMEQSKRRPSFFKKLLGDFNHKLKIPPAFLKNFQGNVPKILLVKCGGRSWFIRTEESDEGYHFSQGLAEFVKDLHLELGDLLIFSMVGHDTFEVVVYDIDCCEKNTISASSYGRQPCANAEGESGRFVEVKKEEEESVMGSERYIPDRHPHFVRSMRKYELRWLKLPAAFAREAGLKSKRRVVIEDPLRRMWPVRLRHYVRGISVSGWSSVVEANDLTTGDTLMFEYLRGSGDAIALRIVSRAARDGAGPADEKRA